MKSIVVRSIGCALVVAAGNTAWGESPFTVSLLGRYETGVFAESALEIGAHDPALQRIFAVNGNNPSFEIIDISNPASPQLVEVVDVAALGGGANSLAVRGSVVAVAIQAHVTTDPGIIAFYNTSGEFLNAVQAGALPDMVTFTPNGRMAISANEGEPNDDYTVDPEGSVTIVDLSKGIANLTQADATTIDFAALEGTLPAGARQFGPGASLAQDFEPEYIAVSHDSKTAWVACQENNALAVVDLRTKTVTALVGLGFKDHSLPGNEIDASDRDGGINIANWPVFGMYLPDSTTAFRAGGRTFIATANEGDSRDYDGFSEEARVKDLTLDPTAFPNAATLQSDVNLGRLKVTTTRGDADGDGEYEELYSFGARSFSIWRPDGTLVFDSGSEFETIVAAMNPAQFNFDNDENDSFDSRSDDKGPEPEAIAVERLFGRLYAFIGLERIGGVMVYDVTAPARSRFVTYFNTRDFAGDPEAGTAGDLGPESVLVIKEDDSPTGNPMLAVLHEVSGSMALYEITNN